MDEEYKDQIEEIIALSESPSARKLAQALEKYAQLPEAIQCQTALRLFESPHKDVREAVLELCDCDVVSGAEWKSAIAKHVSGNPSEACKQCILVCMQRMDSIDDPSLKDFYRKCIHSDDQDIAYQAFCVAELCEESSEEYLDLVKKWIDSEDKDFRIVAIQAISRLKPSWGASALAKRSETATGDESFQVLLSHIRITTDDKERNALLEKLADVLPDERYAFPAIQALSQYGATFSIPRLMKLARSFFAEPTLRVAAAGAAAKLGSDDGLALLKKFATTGHENPTYAQELLSALKKSDNNDEA